jgi:hypothetical protein
MQRSRTYGDKTKVFPSSIFVMFLLHLLRCSFKSNTNLQSYSHCSTPCLYFFKCLLRKTLYTRIKLKKYGRINVFL